MPSAADMTQVHVKNFVFKENVLHRMCLLLCTSSKKSVKVVSRLARKMANLSYQAQLAEHCNAALRFDFASEGPFRGRNISLIVESSNKL